MDSRHRAGEAPWFGVSIQTAAAIAVARGGAIIASSGPAPLELELAAVAPMEVGRRGAESGPGRNGGEVGPGEGEAPMELMAITRACEV